MHSATEISRKAAPGGLVRELNLGQSAAVVVGTIIGSGIFLVPAEMMQAVGSAKLVYLAWVVGGLLSFFGALTYAELGAMKPQAGGEYVYVRDGYGPLWGFLYAWTWFAVAKPASIATITAGIVRVLGTFSAFAFLRDTLIKLTFTHSANPRILTITFGHLVGIGATVFISWLNYRGIKKAGSFQLFFTLLKIAMIAGIVAVVFTAPSGSWKNFATTFAGSAGGFSGFMVALVAALWAYDGWNDLCMVAGEVKNPERNIPMALIIGVAVVAALYMGVNAAVQYVMPAAEIANAQVPASQATQIALGAWGAALVSAGMALSMFVTLNGTIMSGARIPYAVARDGYFFSALAEAHPKFHTPGLAIIVQAVMGIALLLIGGAFQELLSLAIYSEWLFYMIAASTIFVFRWREPGTHRPYRTWGYPVVPALFIAASAVLLYFSFAANLRNSILGTAVIVSGIPVFLYFKTKRAA